LKAVAHILAVKDQLATAAEFSSYYFTSFIDFIGFHCSTTEIYFFGVAYL
jgi:hypothetical protein